MRDAFEWRVMMLMAWLRRCLEWAEFWPTALHLSDTVGKRIAAYSAYRMDEFGMGKSTGRHRVYLYEVL